MKNQQPNEHENHLNNKFDDNFAATLAEMHRLPIIRWKLRQTDRLCEGFGEEVLTEFQFKGDYAAVENQLTNRIVEIEIDGLGFDDIQEVKNGHERLSELHKKYPKSDFYIKNAVKAFREGNFDEGLNEMAALNMRKKLLHEKKECICYNN